MIQRKNVHHLTPSHGYHCNELWCRNYTHRTVLLHSLAWQWRQRLVVTL